MADPDRTEKATPKRRNEARGKGQVARSQDLSSVAGLLAGFAALAVGGPSTVAHLEAVLRQGLAQSSRTTLDGSITMWALGSFARVLAPVVLAALLAGVLANVAQVKLKFTPAALKPTFGKLNPATGLKRMFGPSSVVETAKSLLKLLIVGGTAFLAVWPKLAGMGMLVGLPPDALLSQLGAQVVSIVARVGALLFVLALGDWLWQRRKLEKALRMSKAEVKQEARQTDIAPEIRGALRRKQFALARRRMLAAVPTADVVVVNPTHFACALRYDGSKPAPELVAKGVDHVAAAIREAAELAGVPIVSNPPLARTIYREVELNQLIPEDLFAAVAEVLAYVFRIARRRSIAA